MRSNSLVAAAFACLLVLGSLPTAHAQVELQRLYPPVVPVSTTTTVKAEGKFPNWPATILSDRDDVYLEAGKDSGTIQVTVDADAAPGIAWVRMHDAKSASPLLPLLIVRDKLSTETEPNNQLGQSNKLELPTVVAGRLEKSGDVDGYAIQLTAGQTLVASVRANQILGAAMDAVMQLVDSRGNVVAQADDVRGLDPQLVYVAPSDAVLHLRLFAFPETPNSTIGFAGNAAYVYALQVTTGPFVDHTLPLLVARDAAEQSDVAGWNLPEKHSPLQWSNNFPTVSYLGEASGWQWHADTPSNATTILESDTEEFAVAERLPIVFSGRLKRPGEIDRVQFPLQAGQRYRMTVHARRFGFELDSVLKLVDVAAGTELATNDDRSRNQFDAALEYKADKDKQVELQISDLVDNHGIRAAYSITVERIEPSVEVSLPAGQFTVSSDKPTEIAVTINRNDGYDSKLRVIAEELPEGVQFEPAISESKGDSAKTVKVKLTCDPNVTFQGNMRIVAHELDSDDQPSGETVAATYTLANSFARSDVWLTVVAK